MTLTTSPAGWYPDPGRAHEWRFFDGDAWTPQVADGGQVSEAPLGPVPPGLVQWFPPQVMAAGATATGRVPEVPRVKMWVLAALSPFVFWVRTPDLKIVLPIGVPFAIWCWYTTTRALAAHKRVASPAVTEIKAARWVALGLGLLGLVQVALWAR
jgi:hypothetical protein